MVQFLVTFFYHTNWLQKESELYLHRRCWYCPLVILTVPFIALKTAVVYKYSKQLAWAYNFNANIRYEKYAKGPKISPKTYQNMKVLFGNTNHSIYWLKSWGSLHVFKIWYLHCKCELKPVVLSTMNPINRGIFLS